VLLEHGLEEQMNKLIRIGIPIYDLNKKLNNNTGLLNNGINDVVIDISKSVFSDYLRNTFPKDVLDMHFNGEIHLDDLGNWGICPDTIFIDVENIMEKSVHLNVQFPYLPHISKPDDVGIVLPLLVSIFQKEVSKEIVIENILRLFDGISSNNDIPLTFANSLLKSSFSIHSLNSPFITIVLPLKDNDEVLLNVLHGYLMYLEKVSILKFGILVSFSNHLPNKVVEMIAKITRLGGKISLSQASIRSSKGDFKMNNRTSLPVISLHSLSLNLPHLAYQSNKDETYFRTKLALLLKPSLDAMVSKKDMIFDNVRRGLLPAISNSLMFPQSGSTNILINLTGLNESIFNILGYSDNHGEGIEIVKKVIKTANDVISHFDKKNYDHFGISIIDDNSPNRFLLLDSEKFGRISHTFGSYSQGLTITKNDLDKDNSMSRKLLFLEGMLTGGFSVKLDTTALSLIDAIDFLSKSVDFIPYFDIIDKQVVCGVYSSRVLDNNICSVCKSNN
jgi:ribonucleoside-triphosphate reductase